MALGKMKDTWFIWALVIVAGVFAYMAFNGTKPKEQMVPVKAALVEKAPAAVPAPAENPAPPPVAGIKPDHTATDMQEIAANKPAESVVVAPQPVSPTRKFAVQVYSFKEKARAEAALQALKDNNYKAYIMVSDLGSRGTWYRVRVGSFANEAEAQKSLESITKEFKSGIIVAE